MQVKILSENGYEEALFGLGLSHGVTSGTEFGTFQNNQIPFVCNEQGMQMKGVAQRLAGKGMGHDKFLRQIIVWLDCVCPRYFWPEMDQYKVATVTQSESTMHTITKKVFDLRDFEFDPDVDFEMQGHIELLNTFRRRYFSFKNDGDNEMAKLQWRAIIQILPQSYLQRRILTCNYETLRNIIKQRTGHKLSEWAIFIDAIKSQAQHPELLNV